MTEQKNIKPGENIHDCIMCMLAKQLARSLYRLQLFAVLFVPPLFCNCGI